MLYLEEKTPLPKRQSKIFPLVCALAGLIILAISVCPEECLRLLRALPDLFGG
jgi:hypothetical protein